MKTLSALGQEMGTVRYRAENRHDETCARGRRCSARAWHIASDFLPSERRRRADELRAAAERLTALASDIEATR